MMTSAQVVEMSVNVTNNSPSRDYSHPDDQTTQTKKKHICGMLGMVYLLSWLKHTTIRNTGVIDKCSIKTIPQSLCGGCSVSLVATVEQLYTHLFMFEFFLEILVSIKKQGGQILCLRCYMLSVFKIQTICDPLRDFSTIAR